MLKHRVTVPLEHTLMRLARRVSPEVTTLKGEDLLWRLIDLLIILYALPLALVGLIWLILITDLDVITTHAPMLVLLTGLAILFSQFEFFTVTLIRGGATITQSVSLNAVIGWFAVMMYGPSALWVYVPIVGYDAVARWRFVGVNARWGMLQNLLARAVFFIFSMLVSLEIYEFMGGNYPLSGLTIEDLLPAWAALIAWLLQTMLFYLPIYLIVHTRMIFRIVVVMALADPFAFLAAAVYTRFGFGVWTFLMTGMLMVALLANRLSRAGERTRQRSRELEKLEAMARAMMRIDFTDDELPALLHEHLPIMFPRTDIEVKLFPDQTLLMYPERREPLPESFWEWLRDDPRAQHFARRTRLPWGQEILPRSVLVVPILDAETHDPIGGIYMVVGNIYSRWDPGDGASLIPALQTMASQIASAQRRTDVYEQMLTHQRLAGELHLAGEIQTSFLPRTLPHLPGWEIAASLEPARQTSGDFYDIMQLPNGCLGIVIADVADKGLGAALQMAHCRTLMRTYTGEHTGHPGKVLRAVNSRILADTTGSTLFVTMVYGILDPRSGEFAYANAGHNPPYLLNGSLPRRIPSEKAIPVGLFERGKWKRNSIFLNPGDVLVMYTDGITEAQNRRREFFGEERMVEVLDRNREHSAEVIRAALLREVHRFMNGAPVADDITMVVVKRI